MESRFGVPANIYRPDSGEPTIIQRILRRGSESEGDATSMAATQADDSPTAMPSQAGIPAMPAAPAAPTEAPAMAQPTAAELSQRGREALANMDMPSTPDDVEFGEDQPQTWQGNGGYYYKYTPASGNKPATIQMHGGRYNRENPVTISETGPEKDAFAAIVAEAKALNTAGRAGQYITPRQYAKQRRDQGIPSPIEDNERVEQVVAGLAEEGRVPGSTGRPVSPSQLRIAEIEGRLADERDAAKAARDAGTDTPPPTPADPFPTSPRPNLGTSERPLETTADERVEYMDVINTLAQANPYFIARQGSILVDRISNPALRERARKFMVALSENP